MKRLLDSITLVVLIALIVDSSLYAQAPAKKKGPTVQGLQQQVIDLQTKLMECQGEVKAAHAVAVSPPNPMKEALEAFQTFNSTIDTGVNYTAYRDALIPLKVKVDRLPNDASTANMKPTVETFVDAGHLWNMVITEDVIIKTELVAPYIVKYNETWQVIVADAKKEYKGKKAFLPPDKEYQMHMATKYVYMFYHMLITKGQADIKGFATAGKL